LVRNLPDDYVLPGPSLREVDDPMSLATYTKFRFEVVEPAAKPDDR